MRQNDAIIMQGADIDITDASTNHVAPQHCWLCRTPLMAQQLSLCSCNYQCRCENKVELKKQGGTICRIIIVACIEFLSLFVLLLCILLGERTPDRRELTRENVWAQL